MRVWRNCAPSEDSSPLPCSFNPPPPPSPTSYPTPPLRPPFSRPCPRDPSPPCFLLLLLIFPFPSLFSPSPPYFLLLLLLFILFFSPSPHPTTATLSSLVILVVKNFCICILICICIYASYICLPSNNILLCQGTEWRCTKMSSIALQSKRKLLNAADANLLCISILLTWFLVSVKCRYTIILEIS